MVRCSRSRGLVASGVRVGVMVKIVIEDLNSYESTSMGAQLNKDQDEVSYVQGIAAGLQAWLKRHVNVDHVEGVWYVTIEEPY